MLFLNMLLFFWKLFIVFLYIVWVFFGKVLLMGKRIIFLFDKELVENCIECIFVEFVK